MKYAVVVVAALLFAATAVEAAPRRRGRSASGAAAAGAAGALANLCKPTITCRVGDNPAFVVPRKSTPTVGHDGKLNCRYEVQRSGKKWVATNKSRCSQVPVTQCTNITTALMRVRTASVSYMNATPQNGKCLVMPRVSLKQK